jgi:ribosome-binding factor A
MADPARAKRLAKRISTVVASAIEYEIKDPRLAGVTITDAKVTNDLHDATLYYTVLGPTLDDATGVRFTPTLAFQRDTVPDAAHRMEELLARARAADADVARIRQGATPAGEADPYRVTGGEESGGRGIDAPEDDVDLEDTGDRDRTDD